MAKKNKNNFIGRFLCNLNLHIWDSFLKCHICKRCGKTKQRTNIVEVETCYNELNNLPINIRVGKVVQNVECLMEKGMLKDI